MRGQCSSALRRLDSTARCSHRSAYLESAVATGRPARITNAPPLTAIPRQTLSTKFFVSFPQTFSRTREAAGASISRYDARNQSTIRRVKITKLLALCIQVQHPHLHRLPGPATAAGATRRHHAADDASARVSMFMRDSLSAITLSTVSTITCVCDSTSTLTASPSCKSPNTVTRSVSGIR